MSIMRDALFIAITIAGLLLAIGAGITGLATGALFIWDRYAVNDDSQDLYGKIIGKAFIFLLLGSFLGSWGLHSLHFFRP